MINSLPTHKHSDDRRILIEWIKDFPVRTCKALIIKKDCMLGDHYHKNKDEIFYLLYGSGEVTLNGETEKLKEGDIVFAGRGIKHTFKLKKQSILLEAGTKPFDPKDDYK